MEKNELSKGQNKLKQIWQQYLLKYNKYFFKNLNRKDLRIHFYAQKFSIVLKWKGIRGNFVPYSIVLWIMRSRSTILLLQIRFKIITWKGAICSLKMRRCLMWKSWPSTKVFWPEMRMAAVSTEIMQAERACCESPWKISLSRQRYSLDRQTKVRRTVGYHMPWRSAGESEEKLIHFSSQYSKVFSTELILHEIENEAFVDIILNVSKWAHFESQIKLRATLSGQKKSNSQNQFWVTIYYFIIDIREF